MGKLKGLNSKVISLDEYRNKDVITTPSGVDLKLKPVNSSYYGIDIENTYDILKSISLDTPTCEITYDAMSKECKEILSQILKSQFND